MSFRDVAISIRGLGKSYVIRHEVKRTTLGERVAAQFRHPFARARRESFDALKDVSLDVKKGDVLGIIGRNGAGKSTLLKILSRVTAPTRGRIEVRGRIGSLLEVGTGFHQELTGRENIFLNGAILGMRRREIQKQFDAIVDFAGTEKFLDTPVKRYSSGMYVRLAFAVAAHLNPEILVIDEVLSVGDAEFQRRCLGKMKDVAGSGRTVLFVSHNMAAVQGLCTHGLHLASGEVRELGPAAKVIDGYLAEDRIGEAIFARGPLKWVRARQVNDALQIEAGYEHTEPLSLPSLGFVVSDTLGTPVFGLNPHLSGIDRVACPKSAGVIVASVTSPRLNDGRYQLSVWFGDGFHDFVVYHDCVSFEVSGWAGPRQLPARVVGAAVPECTWDFDPAQLPCAV